VPEPPLLYTIGHGRRPWEEFVAILDRHAIDRVVDVRWKPASRWCPWANRRRLEAALKDRYVWDGARLGNASFFGAEPVPESEYLAGLSDLEARIRCGERVVIMCSETNPANCHRTAIAQALERRGISFENL